MDRSVINTVTMNSVSSTLCFEYVVVGVAILRSRRYRMCAVALGIGLRQDREHTRKLPRPNRGRHPGSISSDASPAALAGG